MTPLRNSVQQFARAMQQRLTPGVRYHQDTFVEVLGSHVPAGGHCLGLGCGHQLLLSWQSAREREFIAAVARIDIISSYPGLGMLPPLAFLKLLGIRRPERPSNERWRHNLIGALRKDPRA